MIQRHRGDNGHIRVDGIGGVQPSAKTHLHKRNINFCTDKTIDSGQGGKFKIGQAGGLAPLVDLVKGVAQPIIAHRLTIDADTLVEMQKMGRGKQPHSVAGCQQNRFQNRQRRAFSVGAADGDGNRCWLEQREPFAHLANAVQAKIDFMFRARLFHPG